MSAPISSSEKYLSDLSFPEVMNDMKIHARHDKYMQLQNEDNELQWSYRSPRMLSCTVRTNIQSKQLVE